MIPSCVEMLVVVAVVVVEVDCARWRKAAKRRKRKRIGGA